MVISLGLIDRLMDAFSPESLTIVASAILPRVCKLADPNKAWPSTVTAVKHSVIAHPFSGIHAALRTISPLSQSKHLVCMSQIQVCFKAQILIQEWSQKYQNQFEQFRVAE
jgi:hypothetical protein